jgi:tRNA pseudouridine13 synthase
VSTFRRAYLTGDLPGLGGVIKQRPEDFRVDEIPLYPACGEGTHVYVHIEKRGIPTPAAVERLARHLNRRPSDIGVAGLKDAQAVATQYFSVEHVDPQQLGDYHDPRLRVLDTARHTNKLRTGHLAGNRFTIRIRQIDPADLPAAKKMLDVLIRQGVPNYFGRQRFGRRGDTADLGEALVREDLQGFVELFLGRARPGDPRNCRAARDAFDIGDYARALKCWPRHYANQRKALAAYRKRRRATDALRAIDKRMKRLFISAFQSEVFNAILTRRIETIDRLMVGDLARKTDTGGIFPVEDLEAEQPRCDRFEISPTGLLPGSRVDLATGQPGRIEQAVLQDHAITPQTFISKGSLKLPGSRRPLRFALDQADLSAGEDEFGPYLQLRFIAPSGCYATVVVEEITKSLVTEA